MKIIGFRGRGAKRKSHPRTLETNRCHIENRQEISPQNGFTLIELTVVVALIGVVLVFALPRVDRMMAGRDPDRILRRISQTARQLRTEAVRTQRRHTLHLDLDAQRIWWDHDGMGAAALSDAYVRGLALTGDVALLDVAYPGNRTVTGGRAAIRFFPRGYSEMAAIHLQGGDGARMTLKIEPFLSGSRVYQGHFGLADPLPDET